MNVTRNDIAVVNCDSDRVAVWQVASEPDAQAARLCGAWVTNDSDVHHNVCARRRLVVVADSTDPRIAALIAASSGVVDVAATVDELARYIAELDSKHRLSRTASGNPRAVINWPNVPPPLTDPGVVPLAARSTHELLARSTMAVANWVAGIINTWTTIETLRLSRAHLAGDAPQVKPVPFSLSSTDR